jgi:hypothetical protein
MEWLAEIIGRILFSFIFDIILYPLGLIRLWIKGGFRNSFLQLIRRYSFKQIAMQGRACILDIIAGAGAIVMSAALFVNIG